MITYTCNAFNAVLDTDRVKEALSSTGCKIIWMWDYASPTSNYPLIDRGYIFSTTRGADAVKKALGIPSDVAISDGDREAMFIALGGDHHPYTSIVEGEFTDSVEMGL